MDKKNQHWAYEAEVVRCHACAAKDRAGKTYTEQDGADTSGLMTRLVRTPND